MILTYIHIYIFCKCLRAIRSHVGLVQVFFFVLRVSKRYYESLYKTLNPLLLLKMVVVVNMFNEQCTYNIKPNYPVT